MLTKAYIPYRGYYSSPFARWQGSLANENSIQLAAETAKRWLTEKNWDPKIYDYLYLGITVHQHHGFYGGPWAAAMMGATGIPGVLVSQACSTSTICVYQASAGIEAGLFETPMCLMTDRCSNGPHAIWPNPKGPGAQVISEDWLMDNFGRDPWAGEAMIKTAENVSAEAGIAREQCDAVTLRRYEQYKDGLADDRAFQKRYMYPVMIPVSKKKTIMFEEDEGIMETTAEGLAKLKPVLPGGVHTFGAQTHPADGHCAITVATREKAKNSVLIRMLRFRWSLTVMHGSNRPLWRRPYIRRFKWPWMAPVLPPMMSKPSKPTTRLPPMIFTLRTNWVST